MRSVRFLSAALLFTACVSEPEETTLRVDCTGKCDGWGSIRSLWRDASKLDLGDLLAIGSHYATDELNDALAITDYAQIQVGAPKLYTTPARAAQDLTLGNIDSLVTGLGARFGENELTTRVNALRQDTLDSGRAEVFGEAAFRIGAQLHPSWNIDTGGLTEVTTWLGFDAGGTLEARVISAYGGELSGTLRSPLDALKAARGFVLPRSLDDVRAMRPGESFALKGQGRLGVNVGVGVPILVAEPTSWITYSLVLSAGLRTALEGQLDVQLVRLDGDQVVVDVGLEDGFVRSARLALDDAWGVQGLLESHVTIGPFSIDLGRLVEKALQDILNAKLSLISARVESGSRTNRLSVARLRFSLDAGGEGLSEALSQALRGDVRLAQALANRGEPGVVAEFDLSRSGLSTASYAGIDIFGMSFFHEVETAQGQVAVQTPGGASTLYFDSLHRASGWFFSSHGYTRVGLSGLVFDPKAPGVAQGEANLIFQLAEGDDFMERDKLLDHLDGVIRQIGGEAALHAVEVPGNALELYVEHACPNSQAFDPCRKSVLSDPVVIGYRQSGHDALAAAVAGLEPSQRDLVIAAGTLRLTAQATYEPHAGIAGPETSVVLDARYDDEALSAMMTEKNGHDFTNAIVAYLQAARVEREDPPATITDERATIAGDFADRLGALAGIYDDHRGRYERLLAVESASIENLGPVGPRALELRFPVDSQDRVDYEHAAVSSISFARTRVITQMIDALTKKADGMGESPERVLGYALLGLAPPERTDVRLDIKMDLSDDWAQSYDWYRLAGYAPMDAYAKGSAVSPIDGGLFSIDALISLPKP